MDTAPYFIVNPTAGGGRARRWWRTAEPILRKHFPHLGVTLPSNKAAAADAVGSAVADGHRWLVGVGGDGTHHDLINALIATDALNELTYTPLPFGSGNDWCRTLGLPRHLLRWIEVVRRGRTVRHAIGRLAYGPTGNQRYFVNVAGLAYDATVVRKAESLGYKHRLLYPVLTMCYLPGYRPPALQLTYDGRTVTGRFHTINLGIGRYNGGGMRLLPQADPRADTLALTFARNLPVGRIVANGWRFFTDSIGRVEGVTTTHARRVTVAGPTGLEADGEWLGYAPVTAEITDLRLIVSCGTISG